MESNDNSSEPVVHKFGDEDFSDVTFIAGGEEFKCNKTVLANRSSYFKTMLFSDFKEKNLDKIPIEADPMAFKHLMEFIYTGQFSDWKAKLSCSERCRTDNTHIAPLWQEMTPLLNLADQYDVKEYVVTMLESCFIRSNDCRQTGQNCGYNGAKHLIAAMYDMEDYKVKIGCTRMAVDLALGQVKLLQPTFDLDGEQLHWLMKLH